MTTPTDPPPPGRSSDPASRLRIITCACRLRFRWPSSARAYTPRLRRRLNSYDGEAEPYRWTFDAAHPAFRAVTALRRRIAAEWRSRTIAYPEPATRLVRLSTAADLDAALAGLREELRGAVAELDRHYGEAREEARRRLGMSYRAADYHDTLAGLFGVAWDFPPTGPPHSLLARAPALYRRELRKCMRAHGRAVEMAERESLEVFSRLAGRLHGRLARGGGRSLRDAEVGELAAFLDRFAWLSVRSSDQLEELVARAKGLLRGVGPAELREQAEVRGRVAEGLGQVVDELTDLLAERPRPSRRWAVPDEDA
jgi:hypothetical protein